jgi:hypothetical protein
MLNCYRSLVNILVCLVMPYLSQRRHRAKRTRNKAFFIFEHTKAVLAEDPDLTSTPL